ncbi:MULTISPECIES: hypothetical protein [unclassified Rhodococcus (in: high G+C Gram-positive bacteria)]|uniref:hypothetical protein n=1 Tax=unclassified Rhodococcus (in: high G+C Gram-positive bacteria) TaxID=192944 RepID=UPI0020786025|nr:MULTISPECIES: hypothetical protein [unclassified Rhodococcus (in: high G+C Gram-positive bacteria)]
MTPSEGGHLPINALSLYHGVALQLALRHHLALVDKLVWMSATYRQDGWYPSVLAAIEGLDATAFAGTPSRGRSRSTRRTPRRSTPTSRR